MSNLIMLSDAAVSRVKGLVAKSEGLILGLRVKVKNGGCSGLSYILEPVYTVVETDEVIEDKGVKIFVDQTAVIFLVGTELDYQKNLVESSFVFRNPNEKGRCGCGSSFRV